MVFIYDAAFFDFIESHVDSILNKDPAILKQLIQRSCEIKAEVVGIDEKESWP